MRILHIYRTYFPDPPGGLQEAIRQIIISTASYGVESRVFTLSPKPTPEAIQTPEATVIRGKSWFAPASCDIGGLSTFNQFSKLARWADVLHYHYPWPFGDLLHSISKPNTPAIMTYHSDIVRQKWLGKVYAPLRDHMLQEMKAIVATSPAYAQTSPILSSKDISPLVKIIPLGIEESSYVLKESNVLTRLKIENNDPFILFIGVLRYYKGLHTLIQSSKLTKARIIIAGSGPEYDLLKNQAENQGSKNVVFAGQISNEDKVTLLKHCRALVLPSHLRSEAFGMVLIEAAMFGKPMISCEIGTGTSFVNSDGVTGFVIPPENPIRLAQVISLLVEDKSLAQQLGAGARNRYSKFFSGIALGQAYSNLYSNVKILR